MSVRAVDGTRVRKPGRIIQAVLAALLALAIPMATASPAAAAGNGVLTVTVEPVLPADGSPQTWAGGTGYGTGTGLGLRISYSCSNDNCDGSIVRIAPAPKDPTYGVYQHLIYNNWTAPFVGATISGTAAAGYAINLGDLAAGAAGSFQVNYTWEALGFAGHGIYTMRDAQFWPNGTPLSMTVTAESTSISNDPNTPATLDDRTATVEWRSTIINPGLSLSNPGSRDAGTQVQYGITMHSGCLPIRESAPKGDARYTCAKSYTVVHHLDPRATYVSATGGGVYDAATHTVTWTMAPAPGRQEPAAGWYLPGNSSKYGPRYVTVTYPPEAFSPSGTDTDYCNFTEPVTTSVDLTMIYLGAGGMADNSNVRTAMSTQTHNVSCIRPFAKAIFNHKASTYDGPARISGDSPVVVQPAAELNRHYWEISVGNQANVSGVAVIEDDLDVEGALVDQIIAYAPGSSVAWPQARIDWELDDGTTGFSMGTATAPAGRRFVHMSVTSGELPAANQLQTGTAQKAITVRAYYAVAADAPVGQTRSNTATARMTYPDYPTLSDVVLNPQTHDLLYLAPFGRGVLSKSSTNSGTAGQIIPPSTGTATHYWSIVVRNTGNVPAQAVIEDTGLDGRPVKVTYITHTGNNHVNTPAATVEYTLNTGVTGTAAIPFTAPTGTWITAVRATTGMLQPVNATTAQNTLTSYYELRLAYNVTAATPDGSWTNTASAKLTYPNMGVADVVLPDATFTVTYGNADLRPRLAAQFVGSPVVEGGGLAVPGRDVTYQVRGTSSLVPEGEVFNPQYVFLAPPNWEVVDGSASFAAGTVPAGVTFSYRTVTISGVARSLVVASWPAGTNFGANATLPTMTVKAQPTFSALSGSAGVASAWVGEADHNWTTTQAVYTGAVTDASDVDADGVATEGFATVNSSGVTVGAAARMEVIKEICFPDASLPGGCDWISEPGSLVGVNPTASNITYRVRIVNSGNMPLTNLVAYDVLPYIGDMGTSTALASTPRGSTFQEVLNSVTASSGVSLAFSGSTNPCRAQVNPGAVGCVNDWTAGTAAQDDAQSIRATATATLAPGSEVSFQYAAKVVPGAAVDAVACNSVAAKADQVGIPAEPQPVCATTQQADLQLTVPARLPLQIDRPGVVPFTVVNAGPSALAPAIVNVEIPAGMRVTGLTPAGWSCTVPGATQTGPVTLTCTAQTVDGAPRLLAEDVPDALDIPVVPTSGDEVCVDGTVHGPMFDPDLDNNDASGCFAIAAGRPQLHVQKDDGRTAAMRGDEYTYTITLTNGLVGEPVADATLTDELPAGLVYVSSSDGGAYSGGVVTWTGIDLAPAGTASGDGDVATGGAGSSVTRTVTVRVADDATGTIENVAKAEAPDPYDSFAVVTGEDSDTDDLLLYSIEKTANAPAEGVYAGDEVTYTVTLTNEGTAELPSATIRDVLTDVLDDAAFVSGSASITVTGSAPATLPNPAGGELSWTGAVPENGTAVLSYRVTVGDGGDGILANTAFTSSASGCDAVTGLAADGAPCASTSNRFGPTVAKSVGSLQQNDDGTWTIVYDVQVVNNDPGNAVSYALSDGLRFGAGITPDTAQVTTAPAGVAPQAWTGSGAVTDTVTLPAGATHSYQLTVVADAGEIAGTAAAACIDGAAGGFGNLASIQLPSGRTVTSEACAEPIAPTVTKVAGASTQRADGSWQTVYDIVVAAPAESQASELAYTLDDAFDLPAGVTVVDVLVEAPAGADVNPGFDGVADTALLAGVDRVTAGSSRSFTVTLVTEVPAGAVTGSELACAPAGTGGYANTVSLLAGGSDVVSDEASACAAIVAEPMPHIVKSLQSSSVDAVTGDWTLVYRIAVSNPDASYSTEYDLEDEQQFGAGVSIVSAAIDSGSPSWDGTADTVIAQDVALAAGATDVYEVTVVATPPAVVDDSNDAAMDCRIDAGETGTGFLNVATVTSGMLSSSASACEAATDPSVVKRVVGEPVQDPATGLWEIEYEVVVTNRSTTTAAGGTPYSLNDEFGFPAGTVVRSVDVTGPGTVNPDFDGDTDTALATGSIEAAVDDATPTRHTYTVTVVFEAVTALAPQTRLCAADQGSGGLRNETEIVVGSRTTAAVACTDAPEAPVLGVAKDIVSQHQLPDGTWSVTYQITVANPSPSIAALYDLADEFAFGEGIVLDQGATVPVRPAGVIVDPSWDGEGNVTLVEDVVLGGGATHQYRVNAIVDSGSIRGTDAAGDCVLAAGEEGTGFSNEVSLTAGDTESEATACASAVDPAVTKSVNGAPVRNADGTWTVSYVVTVTNPSSTVGLSYELRDELSFPSGTVIEQTTATGRTGAPTTSATWDGTTDLVVVPAGATLPAGAVHVFDVSVTAALPADQTSVDAGWLNRALVASSTGGVVESEDETAADIDLPELHVSKSSDATGVVRIGDQVTYTVVVENVGEGDFTSTYPAEVWDDLSGVLDDATLGEVTVDTADGALTTPSGYINWSGPLASGASVTLEYTVTVTAEGDQSLENAAFVAAPSTTTPATPDPCVPGACSSTSSALSGFQIEKFVSAGVVAAGDTVDYEVVYTNTGQVDVADATFTDDLSEVLDDAVLDGEITASSGAITASGDGFVWDGSLAAGESVTVTYSVIVNASLTGDRMLTNRATADEDFATRWPGGVCPDSADSCAAPPRTAEVQTAVRSLAFTKVADAAVTTFGQTIAYTVTVTNLGATDFTEDDPATVVDTLAGVLDDARYNGDATASAGTVSYSSPTLSWSGPLAAGATATIRYTVTVKDTPTGDADLDNVIGLDAFTGDPDTLSACGEAPTDNAQTHCVVRVRLQPLAVTGGTLNPVLVPLGLLLALGGALVLLARRRARTALVDQRPALSHVDR
ncbi:hypothetical protein [Microbacterium sp.]|uniref:DUF7927 domain-containing protein n=1 Tax=Microbacterium sp. TaxID=51671 RepID=UPI0039E28E9D